MHLIWKERSLLGLSEVDLSWVLETSNGGIMTEELNNNEDNQFLVKENDRSSVYQVEIGQLLKVTKQWKKQKNRNVSLRNS